MRTSREQSVCYIPLKMQSIDSTSGGTISGIIMYKLVHILNANLFLTFTSLQEESEPKYSDINHVKMEMTKKGTIMQIVKLKSELSE